MSFRGNDPKFESLTASEAANAGSVDVLVENTSNTASSTARVRVKVAGTSADDAFHTAEIDGGEVYSWGIDNDDSDKFKLSDNATLGTNDVFEVASQVLTTTKASYATSRTKDVADADYTITDTDGFDSIFSTTTLTADRTVTLPTVADATGRYITIKKVDSGAFDLIVDGEGAETIDGATTINLAEEGDAITIVSDGTEWHIQGDRALSRSQVRLHTQNGHGSTNTKIRRFATTIENVGRGITYTDSATDGASFTVNEDGVYAVSCNDAFNGGALFGFSLNSSQLTTNIQSITAADALTMSNPATNEQLATTWVGILSSGDIIRVHTTGVANSSSTTRSRFSMTQVVRHF